jgi:hypothetical protein
VVIEFNSSLCGIALTPATVAIEFNSSLCGIALTPATVW